MATPLATADVAGEGSGREKARGGAEMVGRDDPKHLLRAFETPVSKGNPVNCDTVGDSRCCRGRERYIFPNCCDAFSRHRWRHHGDTFATHEPSPGGQLHIRNDFVAANCDTRLRLLMLPETAYYLGSIVLYYFGIIIVLLYCSIVLAYYSIAV